MLEIFMIIIMSLMCFKYITIFYRVVPKKLLLISPFILFIVPIVACLLLYTIINYSNVYTILKQFTGLGALLIILYTFAYFIGLIIPITFSRKSYRLNKIISYSVSISFIKFCFFITFIIGMAGTMLLLKGMGVNDLYHAFILFLNNPNEFDQHFFNSSASIFWRSNFAAVFFLSFISNKKYTYIFLPLIFISILFRGAFLYIPVLVFLYLVPKIYQYNNSLRKLKFLISLIIIFSVIVLVLFILSSYSIEIGDDSFHRVIFSSTPYSYGSFINFNYLLSERNGINVNLDTTIFGAGFTDIFRYINKIIPIKYLKVYDLSFRPQISSYLGTRYGNMYSFFGQLLLMPFALSVIFVIALGILNTMLYLKSIQSVFFLSTYSWFAVANFLAFSGGGYFSETRFFPIVFYVWPFLIIYYIVKSISAR